MTDEIIEGVKKWTLDEMLESSGDTPKKSKKDKAMNWGRPGNLTKEDLDVYVSNFVVRFGKRREETFENSHSSSSAR
jgi:hypothetical protein